MKILYLLIGIVVIIVLSFIFFSLGDETNNTSNSNQNLIVNENDNIQTQNQNDNQDINPTENLESDNNEPIDTDNSDSELSQEFDWRTAELKNINSGETFTISQFEKPILLESFAVWCPTCTRQQKEIKKLHNEIGDNVVSIALDTDPNEDEAKVKNHASQNGFDWYYAISPKDVTEDLIDDFGNSIVNAPSAPVILICDGIEKRLDNGVKTVSELKGELAACSNYNA